MELMEPETYLLDSQSIELKNAGKWKDGLGICDFLAADRRMLYSLPKLCASLSRKLEVVAA